MVKEGTPVTLRFDALSGEFFPGQIDVIAPALDAQGRAVRLRARIPNSDMRLRPGMFARVQVHLEQHEAVMIPESAIAPSAGEQYIFVLQPDQTVRRRSVKIGIRRGGWVEVSGIEPGQEILITGLQKVRDGAKVQAVSRTVAFEEKGNFMHISELCIRRPVFATVLSLLIVRIGLAAYERLGGRVH